MHGNPLGPPSVEASFRGAHVLLTGFTGFLGKVWAAHVLEELPAIGRLTLLVRAHRKQPAAARVRAILERSPALRRLREHHGADLGAFLDGKLEVLTGDVTQPLCGLALEDVDRLVGTVDVVVHCAGETDFAPDPRRAVAVNVVGARHAADLAARTRGRRLVHVSTAFVAGRRDGRIAEKLRAGESPNGTAFDVQGELRALESGCDAIDRRSGRPKGPEARRARIELGTDRAKILGWPNLYTYSKGLAEQLLAERDDVAITIVRPSVVECAHRFPFPGWNEGLNTSGPIVWMTAGYMWKVPMRGGHRFDVVPVDTVARGLTLATTDALADDAEPVYHLASGDHHPFTFDRALDLTALAVRRGYLPSGVGLFERLALTHLDATPLDRGADRSFWVPTAVRASKFLRDKLLKGDVRKLLPRSLEPGRREALEAQVRDAGLRMNRLHRMVSTVEQIWKLYQPFIHDHDYEFVTEAVRRRTAELTASERARFGWDLEELDWRHYWMDVEIPGLDKWSLPELKGQDVPLDPPWDLGRDPHRAEARLQQPAAFLIPEEAGLS
jgi:nucleoside-diphosphate-sugar epimerase